VKLFYASGKESWAAFGLSRTLRSKARRRQKKESTCTTNTNPKRVAKNAHDSHHAGKIGMGGVNP